VATAGSSGLIGQSAAWFANSFGSLWGGLAFTGVGALVGVLLGTIIGNLFGKKTPSIPTADAETILNFETGYFQVGAVSSQAGGNEELVRNMSTGARDVLNNVVATVVNGSEYAGNANFSSPTQTYGHTGNQLWVKLGSSTYKNNFDSADLAVDFGSLWAIGQTKIVGGKYYKNCLL